MHYLCYFCMCLTFSVTKSSYVQNQPFLSSSKNHCPAGSLCMDAISSQVCLLPSGPSSLFSTPTPEGACYNVRSLLKPSRGPISLRGPRPPRPHSISPLPPLMLLSSHTGLSSASHRLLHDPEGPMCRGRFEGRSDLTRLQRGS